MFTRVEVIERLTRLHGKLGIIVGRTEMAGAHVQANLAVSSSYTHVLVLGHDDTGGW